MKEKCVDYLRGMFAFMIWDREEKKLFGARDHFGIKPLYIAQQGDTTFFASEKKSIMHVMEDKGVNPTSLQHYFTYQYGPEPETLTIDVNKIEPGHYFVKKLVKRWKSIATGSLISMLQVQRKRSISKQFVMCYMIQ